MTTDTDRLARVREFIAGSVFANQYPLLLNRVISWMAMFAADEEVKAAVEAEWTLVNSVEDLPKHTGPWIVSFPGIEDEILTGFDFYDGHRGWRYYNNIIAYMPLPQPYQPKEEQDA